MLAGTEAGLTQLLLDVNADDPRRRKNAEKHLAQVENENFVQYCQALCAELTNETKPEHVRQMAGLMFKNAISGPEPKSDSKKREKWIRMEEPIKAEMRSTLLQVLESNCLLARAAACQCLAKIARLDLPQGIWPEFFVTTDRLLTSESPHARIASYQVLGYVCEDVQSLAEEVNKTLLSDEVKGRILLMLSRGLMEPELDVRLHSLKAFYHGVMFAERFMQIDEDRRNLFLLIGKCLACQRTDVELAAWEVMLQITNEFYPLLAEYMPDLLNLSVGRIQGGQLETALSAVEFWCTICDEEIMILENESSRPMCNFIQTYKASILPALFEAITKDDDEENLLDEWNLPMAAGTAVTLCAQVLKDDILPLALTFIDANFAASTWQHRNAAILVYGSLLEGPSTQACAPVIAASFVKLCGGLGDSSPAVRDTTAWTIGRVAEFHLPAIAGFLLPPEGKMLMDKLISLLNDEPRVAANVCFALYEICAEIPALSAEEFGNLSIDPYFTVMAEALVTVAKRPDANEKQLRQAACHALYILVANVGAGPVQNQAMLLLLEQIMEWMEGTFAAQMNAQLTDTNIPLIQGPMCGCLNALIVRLDKSVGPFHERLFSIFHRTLDNKGPGDTWNEAAEEALLAISALVTAIGTQFLAYMHILSPVLINALRSHEDTQVCSIAIDLAGSLASLGDEIATYETAFTEELFNILKDPNTPIFLKPKAMTALSDFALLTPRVFSKHLKDLFSFLKQAAAAQIDKGPRDSEDWVQYITGLRDATLTAYSSAVCCVRDVADQGSSVQDYMAQPPFELLAMEVRSIIDFVRLVLADTASTESNIKNAVILVGDLVPVFKGKLVSHLRTSPVYTLLRDRSNLSSDVQKESMRLEELMTKFSPMD